jgi:GTP-binding protein
VFADIPGLIEGAHLGVGLGHDFLRHVERTRLLLHLIDITSDDPIADYYTIQEELDAYGRGVAQRPQILALSKWDVIGHDAAIAAELLAQFQAITDVPMFAISAVSRTGLEPLLNQLWQMLEALEPEASQTESAASSINLWVDSALS